MKLFCVLEQGKHVDGSPFVNEHKTMFSTEFSDFYRLNWFDDTDSYANFHQKNITVSEGRSLLYEKVKEKYEYYIQIDDDVIFESNGSNVAEKIRDFLIEYNPLIATCYNSNNDGWHHSDIIKKRINDEKKEVFCINTHDMACLILHKTIASLIYPITYHGSYCSQWYISYLGTILCPNKIMTFTGVKYSNSNHIIHQDNKNPQHGSAESCMNNFSKNLILNTDFDKWISGRNNYITLKNQIAYDSIEPNKYILPDLNKLTNQFKMIYNTDSLDYKYRKTLAIDLKYLSIKINNGINVNSVGNNILTFILGFITANETKRILYIENDQSDYSKKLFSKIVLHHDISYLNSTEHNMVYNPDIYNMTKKTIKQFHDIFENMNNIIYNNLNIKPYINESIKLFTQFKTLAKNMKTVFLVYDHNIDSKYYHLSIDIMTPNNLYIIVSDDYKKCNENHIISIIPNKYIIQGNAINLILIGMMCDNFILTSDMFSFLILLFGKYYQKITPKMTILPTKEWYSDINHNLFNLFDEFFTNISFITPTTKLNKISISNL